jgi:CheY-like chemotaxis protein
MDEPLILVAEDERDIRELLVFTLQFGGFQVVGVSNGEEAVQKALELTPDLILMDVRMPKMSGYEACQRLKEQTQTRDIPVIFLTAKGQEVEVRAGLQAGAEEYFCKPFVPDQLPQRINQILGKHGKL